SLATCCPKGGTPGVLGGLLCPVRVHCRRLEGLFRDYGVQNIEFLRMKTKAITYSFFKSFVFKNNRRRIVNYKIRHFVRPDVAGAEALLRAYGYRLRRDAYDTLAVRLAQNAERFQFDALRNLALSLHADGRSKDALTLLEHLESLQSDDPETLQSLARILGA